MELDELKNYLKVDTDDDDGLIASLQVAAEEYLTNAGVTVSYDNKLYTLAIKLLVSHWYDNRVIQDDKAQAKLSFSLDAILTQLVLISEENAESAESGVGA